jgi:hypothetical protein
MAPPLSRMGILEDNELTKTINNSPLKSKYGVKNNVAGIPSKELEDFYKKLVQINEKQKLANLKEKEREKQKIKQATTPTRVTMPRRKSYTNMMLDSMMPMTNMFSNMMNGANTGINNTTQVAQYYYTKDGQQNGPVSEFQISNSILSGEINSFTYLWKSGMAEWSLATNFQEFQNILK